MLGWFSAEPFYILNGQDVYMLFLDCLVHFVDTSYILNDQAVYVMLGSFSGDPSYILNGQDLYMSCLDGLVQTHLLS